MNNDIYEKNNPLRPPMPGILNLTKLGKPEAEEIPEPGTEGNPWIGVERVVRGQKTFYAFSGAERRRIRRQQERDAVNEREAGERAYNRQQRRIEFDKGTVGQQLRILKGEIPVSDAMRANLEGHILRQTKLNERAQHEPERKEAAEKRRSERLHDRRVARKATGRATKRDLVALGEL